MDKFNNSDTDGIKHRLYEELNLHVETWHTVTSGVIMMCFVSCLFLVTGLIKYKSHLL